MISKYLEYTLEKRENNSSSLFIPISMSHGKKITDWRQFKPVSRDLKIDSDALKCSKVNLKPRCYSH